MIDVEKKKKEKKNSLTLEGGKRSRGGFDRAEHVVSECSLPRPELSQQGQKTGGQDFCCIVCVYKLHMCLITYCIGPRRWEGHSLHSEGAVSERRVGMVGVTATDCI